MGPAQVARFRRAAIGVDLLVTGRAGPGASLSRQGGLAMIPAQNLALNVPAFSPNGSAPHCEHLDGLQPVTPLSDHCRDCQDHTDRQARLVICLTCGWVA